MYLWHYELRFFCLDAALRAGVLYQLYCYRMYSTGLGMNLSSMHFQCMLVLMGKLNHTA